MKLLLNFTIVVLVSVSTLFFEKSKDNYVNETSYDVTFKESSYENEVCRSVNTPCGGGSHSNNVACVTYQGTDGRIGAIFLAQQIASEMGIAACNRMNQITSATANICNNC